MPCPTQVLPSLLLFVPSGQIVFDQIEEVNVPNDEPVKLAFVKFVFAPEPKLLPDKFALVKFVPFKIDPVKGVLLFSTTTLLRLAFVRSALLKAFPEKILPEKFVPIRIALAKSVL